MSIIIHEGVKILKQKRRLTAIVFMLILLFFVWFENQPYKVMHSTIFTSSNLTETHLTIVINRLFPIKEDVLAREIVDDCQMRNGKYLNSYYELELYRTSLHYYLGIPYDTVLCSGSGQIVTEIDF